MWWKLAALALLEAALIGLLFVPVQTHTIKYLTPVATQGHAGEILWQTVTGLAAPLAVVAILATPIWLAYRLVTKQKNSN
jgi:hypothetical protein